MHLILQSATEMTILLWQTFICMNFKISRFLNEFSRLPTHHAAHAAKRNSTNNICVSVIQSVFIFLLK
jgi:hypothetical protein